MVNFKMQVLVEKNKNVERIYDSNRKSWKFITSQVGVNEKLSAVKDTLTKFGLLKNEIKVYLYLVNAGEKKAGEVAEAISLHRTETYRILRDLEKKGVICSFFEKPLKFFALPLDRVIDILVNTQKMKIKLLEKEKEPIVKLWLSIPRHDVKTTKKQLFQILQGKQQVAIKADELLNKTEKEIQIYIPDNYLDQLYYSNFVDNLEKKQKRLDITLVVERTLKNIFIMGKILWLKGKYKMVDIKKLPCFMIFDRKEILLIFQEADDKKEGYVQKKDRTKAIWTNYDAFIWMQQMLFSNLLEKGQKM